jgi:hypothetical protein
MATAKKATAKKAPAKKAAKKVTAKKTTSSYSRKGNGGKDMPAGTAAVYSPIGAMSAAAQAAFPSAGLVFTLDIPADNSSGPVISAFAAPGLRPVRTDLTGRSEIAAGNAMAIQLLPKPGEVLQIVSADGTTTYCISRPRWIWITLPVTQQNV